MSDKRRQGKVKWFRKDKGFGFIEVLEGKDVFFHDSLKADQNDFLKTGDIVEFDIQKSKKGDVAIKVKKVG